MQHMRLSNLYFLAYKHSSQAAVAEKLGIEHKELVRYFNNKHTPISDEFARKIELTFNKPNGWMDRDNSNLALSTDEWNLIQAYRSGSDRDKLYISSLANLSTNTQ